MKRFKKLSALLLAVLMCAAFVTACTKKPNNVTDPNNPNPSGEKKITVTFNLNYGTGVPAPEAPESIQVVTGGKYPKLPEVSRTGYTFGGWYASPTSFTATNKIAEGMDVEDDRDLPLYARWTGINYDITYIITGADMGNVALYQGLKQDEVLKDRVHASVTFGGTYGNAPGIESADENKAFSYWYILDGETKVPLEGTTNIASIVNIAENHFVYAQFSLKKVEWNFDNEFDMEYFHGAGEDQKSFAWVINAKIGSKNEGYLAPKSWDSSKQALKVVNTVKAEQVWVDFWQKVERNTTVTFEVSVENLPGQMKDPVSINLMGRINANEPAGGSNSDFLTNKMVNAVSGAWPTANDGRISISYKVTKDYGLIHLIFAWQDEGNPTDVTNAVYYVHSVKIEPPKFSYTFDYNTLKTLPSAWHFWPSATYDDTNQRAQIVFALASAQDVFTSYATNSIGIGDEDNGLPVKTTLKIGIGTTVTGDLNMGSYGAPNQTISMEDANGGGILEYTFSHLVSGYGGIEFRFSYADGGSLPVGFTVYVYEITVKLYNFDLMLTKAKIALEDATFGPVQQSAVNSASEAKTYVEDVIAGVIGGTDIDFEPVYKVVQKSWVAPVAGIVGGAAGNNGAYEFAIELELYTGDPVEVSSKTLVIERTIFDPTIVGQEITNAKNLIEAAFPVSAGQVTDGINSSAMAAGFVADIISNLDLGGVTAAVDATTAIWTAAIAGTPGEINGTDGSYKFTVILSKFAGANQTTAQLTLNVTAHPYDPTQDNLDIGAAAAIVNGADIPNVAQAQFNTEAAAQSYVEGIISKLSLKGVTASASKISFTAAIAGTTGGNGTNGTYSFAVNLNKGAGTQQTVNKTLTITPAHKGKTLNYTDWDAFTSGASNSGEIYFGTQTNIESTKDATNKRLRIRNTAGTSKAALKMVSYMFEKNFNNTANKLIQVTYKFRFDVPSAVTSNIKITSWTGWDYNSGVVMDTQIVSNADAKTSGKDIYVTLLHRTDGSGVFFWTVALENGASSFSNSFYVNLYEVTALTGTYFAGYDQFKTMGSTNNAEIYPGGGTASCDDTTRSVKVVWNDSATKTQVSLDSYAFEAVHIKGGDQPVNLTYKIAFGTTVSGDLKITTWGDSFKTIPMADVNSGKILEFSFTGAHTGGGNQVDITLAAASGNLPANLTIYIYEIIIESKF